MSARDELIALGVIEPDGIPARLQFDVGPVLRIDARGRAVAERDTRRGPAPHAPDVGHVAALAEILARRQARAYRSPL